MIDGGKLVFAICATLIGIVAIAQSNPTDVPADTTQTEIKGGQ